MKNKFYHNLFLISCLFLFTVTGAFGFSFRNMTLDMVQISDTHISDRENTPYKALGASKNLLKDAIEQVNQIEGLDFVMFTGDMVDSATNENYYNFYYLLTRLKYPSLNTFGNHDIFGQLDKEQALQTVKKYNPNYTFSDTYYAFSPKTDYRIIVLDATIKDQITSNGILPDEQLAFLDNELSQNQDKIVIIAMHHPAVEPFLAHEHSLLNANEFIEILLKYKNPIVVLTGHYHASKIQRFGNLVFVSTPSLVTYPMAFRHMKIINYKDRVYYNFQFIETRLEAVKEENRRNVISYSTLEGSEKDKNISFTYRKSYPRSAKYKRNKIKNAAKEAKTSQKELRKLNNEALKSKTVKTPKAKKVKEPKPEKIKTPKVEKNKTLKPEKAKKARLEKTSAPKVNSKKRWFNFNFRKKATPSEI